MRKFLVKVIALCLVGIMILGSFAGCTKKPTKETKQETKTEKEVNKTKEVENSVEDDDSLPGYLVDTTPITFDLYFNASWFSEQWTTDILTRTTAYITKKTGVSFNLIAPTGDESVKMTTMVASGEVPDFILADKNDPNTKLMIEAGLIEPLNLLADQYDKSFYDIVQPSQVGWFTEEDGNVYGYPNFANAYENALKAEDKTKIAGDTVVAVRKDIYEAIGSPDMTTPDGFLNGLQLAMEKFPTNSTGSPMSAIGIIFEGSGSRFFNGYIPSLLALPIEKDGKIQVNTSGGDPAEYLYNADYITWLKTFRKANEMGLISKDTFIDTRAQHDEKLGGSSYFITTQGRSDIDAGNRQLWLADQGASGNYYIPLDCIRNSKGEDPAINAKIMLDGWMNIYITTNNKDKARAIRFLNYIMGPEGQADAYFGEEGVAWNYVDGERVAKPEFTDGSLGEDEKKNKYMVYGQNWIFTNLDIKDTYPTVDPTPVSQLFREYGAKYLVALPQLNSISIDPASEEGLAQSNINTLWGETLPKLILAKSEADFDSILSDYLAKRDKLGYAKVMAARQIQYDANKIKLGIK